MFVWRERWGMGRLLWKGLSDSAVKEGTFSLPGKQSWGEGQVTTYKSTEVSSSGSAGGMLISVHCGGEFILKASPWS